MLSYRGYGLSAGTPSERGIRIDAQTALDYIRAHPLLKDTPVVAYGQSIGGAVAVDLAARNVKRVSAARSGVQRAGGRTERHLGLSRSGISCVMPMYTRVEATALTCDAMLRHFVCHALRVSGC